MGQLEAKQAVAASTVVGRFRQFRSAGLALHHGSLGLRLASMAGRDGVAGVAMTAGR